MDGTGFAYTPRKRAGGNCGSRTTLEAAMTCTANTNVTEAAGLDVAAVAAGDWIVAEIGAVTGTTRGGVCITYEFDRQ